MAATTVQVNGIPIGYETFGDPADPPMLLVMGLGMQMLAWPDPMCQMLADRGHYVVRFDNRDIGLSGHLDGQSAPSYLAARLRLKAPPYTIDDMADDAVGLLDALGLDSVHLVGASMGGFISQSLAVRHPSRVRSLTLIMTSTGSSLVGQPKLGVLLRTLWRKDATDRRQAQEESVALFRMIGSPGFEYDAAYQADLAGRCYDRAHDPDGYRRQLAAVAGQRSRARGLRQVRVPALVIHGIDDPLVAVSGGIATARRLRNARLVAFTGMGHDFPRALWPDVVREITALTERAEAARGDRDPRVSAAPTPRMTSPTRPH